MGRIRDIPRGLPRNQCWKGITNFLMMSLVCQTSQIQGHQLFKIIPELISYQNNVLSPWRNITSDNAKIDQSQVTSVVMWQCHVTVILYHDKKIEIIMWMELPGWRFLEMDSVIFILQSGEMHSWFKNAAKEMFIQMSPFRLVGIFGSSTSSTHFHLRQKISRFWSIDIFGALLYSI